MKKQTTKTPLTKEDLKKELSNYATKEDLKREIKKSENRLEKKLEKKFDEKLGKRLSDSFAAFRKENNYQFSLIREDLQTSMSKFTNLILTTIDPLLKELETRKEDREIGTAQMEEVKTRINNHEKRIRKLEHL